MNVTVLSTTFTYVTLLMVFVLLVQHSVVFCITLTAAYPDAPQKLQVMSQTWESVELQWTPGFDGGYEQEFVVVVTVPSSQQSALYLSAGSSSSFNVTG